MMEELSYSQVSALLRYDPETGRLFWINRPIELSKSERDCKRFNARFAGKEALTALDSTGYLVGGVLGKHCRAHRVAWLLHYGEWPKSQIDHINGDRTDNRIVNLRDVSCAENQRNKGSRKDNTSGMSGVHWHKPTQRWHVRVGVGGKMKHVAYFDAYEDAVAARAEANKIHRYTDRHGIA